MVAAFDIRRVADGAAIATAAHDLLVTELRLGATAAAEGRPTGSVLLAGGSTPKALYERMVASGFAASPAGQGTLYAFGDVRAVPDSSPDSNFTMAHTALLHAVPSKNVVSPAIPPSAGGAGAETSVTSATSADGSAELQASAAAYGEALLAAVGPAGVDMAPVAPPSDSARAAGAPDTASIAVPVFDVCLLGVGPDGHTASLFPGTRAATCMDAAVTTCTPPEGVSPAVDRISVTAQVIHAARNVVLLAAGASKRWVLEGILRPENQPAPADVPVPVARLLRQCRGRVIIIGDDAALGEITK